jgi:hypothetical protein
MGNINDAIGARLRHEIPPGCEEWSFTMKLTDDETGWGITWGTGSFRVNRKTGVIEGSQLAGLGPGWPGIVGNWNGTYDDDTNGNHFTVTITKRSSGG